MRRNKPWTCPHCGNTDRATIETNGERSTSLDLTLLCLAPCEPGANSFDTTQMEDVPADDPRHRQCGMQWEPNLD